MGFFGLFEDDMDRAIRRAEEALERMEERKERQKSAPPKRYYSVSYGSFVDPRDNTEYKTVQIGNQVWMAENLRYKCSDSYSYKDNKLNDGNYGRLYTYRCLKKACPPGWHVPSEEEWNTLLRYVNENKDSDGVGTCLKADHSCWECHDDVALGTDQFGFGAWPSGYKDSFTFYHDQNHEAHFWSSLENEDDSDEAQVKSLSWTSEDLSSHFESKFWAVSVRCVKD